jgi:conjugative relaxase-like TrwC/TraI family protein
MTVHKLSAGDGYTYLTRQVASADQQLERGQALADYYTATGNPPGRWMGGGAADLGVTGQVHEAQMKALFGRGEHPNADAIAAQLAVVGAPEEVVRQAVRLGRRYPQYETSGRRAVAGYDLVFTPVKSASVLWALGGPEVRAAVEAAHREAVADAIGFLEANAAFTRIGDRGQAQVGTRGLICAAFDHRETRAGDPDLHTHVAVSNKVRTRQDAPGGRPRWRALDGRALYAVGVTASERYNTRFEDALARRLGVRYAARADTVGTGKRPVREIVGVPDVLLRHFSSRRAAIEERYAELARAYRKTHGHDPPRSAQLKLAEQATLETREGKAPPKAFGAQLAEWRAEAERVAGVGIAEQVVAAATGKEPASVTVDDIDIASLARSVIAVLETERSTWSRWNLIAEVERQTRPLRCATPAERERLVDAVVTAASRPRNAVRIAAPSLTEEPAQLRRSDGASVFTPHAAERYTTERILAAEQRLVAAATERTGLIAHPALVDSVLQRVERDEGLPLDAGQEALVRAFLEDDRRIVVGIGPAGSGKTTAMRAAGLAWEASGRRVVPLATSAKAAEVLAADLGRRAENLPKLLHELDRLADGKPPRPGADGSFFTLRPGDVVLVDEAGMAGTLRLDRLVAYARAASAQVRLLGDPAQLAAVEAGGALRLLVAEAGAAHLERLHRFRDPEHAEATLQLRAGDPRGLDYYFIRGRARGGSREAMLERTYEGWRADASTGRISVMVAATSDDVAALNTRARLDRIADGLSEGPGVLLHDGTHAGVGDWIVTRDNQRLLLTRSGRDFVKNGDTWFVRRRRTDGGLLVEHVGHHGHVLLPAPYVAAHVELAYATTAHRVQGATVDTAHAYIAPGTTREALYVAASRAREATTLYVATEDLLDLDAEPPEEPGRTARQILEAVLATESSERSATETIRQTLDDAESLPVLLSRYEHALATANRKRYACIAEAAFGGGLAGTLVTDPAWPALSHALADAEQHGYQAGDVLQLLANRRELEAAESPARLLTSRLHEQLAWHEPAEARRPDWLPSWIPTAPLDRAPTEWRDYLTELTGHIRRRVRHLAEQTAADRPPWLAGEPPPAGPRREAWLERVGVIAAYQEHYGLTAEHPLGPCPPEGSRRQHAWLEAAAALRDLRADRTTNTPSTRPATRTACQTSSRTFE